MSVSHNAFVEGAVKLRLSRSQVQSVGLRLESFGNAPPSPHSRHSRFAAIIGRQVVGLDVIIGAVALMGFADEKDHRALTQVIGRSQEVVESSDAVVAAMRRSDEEAIIAAARMRQAGLEGFKIDVNDLVIELGKLRENQRPVDPAG
jgi:hypothetical protein